MGAERRLVTGRLGEGGDALGLVEVGERLGRVEALGNEGVEIRGGESTRVEVVVEGL